MRELFLHEIRQNLANGKFVVKSGFNENGKVYPADGVER